jgi:hypothetical protein
VLVVAGVVVAITGAGKSNHTKEHPVAVQPSTKAPKAPPTGTNQTTTPSLPRATPSNTTPPTTAPAPDSPLGQAWKLPTPDHYAGTVGVGFPHTTMGALALGYGFLTAQVNVNPDISASVVRATALQVTSTQLAQAAQVTKQARTRFGLPPSGPTSATFSLSIEACRIQEESPNRVVAGYEGTLVIEGPTIQGETWNFAKAIALVSDGTDWRVDINSPNAQPPLAFPGDAQALQLGWHICSEA